MKLRWLVLLALLAAVFIAANGGLFRNGGGFWRTLPGNHAKLTQRYYSMQPYTHVYVEKNADPWHIAGIETYTWTGSDPYLLPSRNSEFYAFDYLVDFDLTGFDPSGVAADHRWPGDEPKLGNPVRVFANLPAVNGVLALNGGPAGAPSQGQGLGNSTNWGMEAGSASPRSTSFNTNESGSIATVPEPASPAFLAAVAMSVIAFSLLNRLPAAATRTIQSPLPPIR